MTYFLNLTTRFLSLLILSDEVKEFKNSFPSLKNENIHRTLKT